MTADQRLADWLAQRRKRDKHGHVYQYHPRSDAHSKALCGFIVDDLLASCEALRDHAKAGLVACGINLGFVWSNGKRKNLDLAIGWPKRQQLEIGQLGIAHVTQLAEVLVSCEAKTVMTEHSKSQPRIFDELSSSHEIVHQGSQTAIAAGITVVNIADEFVSPTRNQSSAAPLEVTTHKQPHVTERMIRHLRGLAIRDDVEGVGFDAYCTFVVSCNNQGKASLWQDAPAPQPGERDHYEIFLARIGAAYEQRFSNLRPR